MKAKDIIKIVETELKLKINEANVEYYGVSNSGKRTLISTSDIVKSSKNFVVIPERVSKSLNLQKVICKLSNGNEIVMDVFDQTSHSGDWTVTYSVEGTKVKSARPDNYYTR
jgi:hypothetical protein